MTEGPPVEEDAASVRIDRLALLGRHEWVFAGVGEVPAGASARVNLSASSEAERACRYRSVVVIREWPIAA